jgi:hypothetical protein
VVLRLSVEAEAALVDTLTQQMFICHRELLLLLLVLEGQQEQTLETLGLMVFLHV